MHNILRNSCCQIQASASCDSDYYQMWAYYVGGGDTSGNTVGSPHPGIKEVSFPSQLSSEWDLERFCLVQASQENEVSWSNGLKQNKTKNPDYNGIISHCNCIILQ